METTTVATECGIFPGMSWADYAAIPLPSASTLEWGRVSSAHLKAAMDGALERKDSDAMSFGRALHLRLLEPDIYPQRVLISEPCCMILQSGKRKGETCANNGVSIVDGVGWCCRQHGGDDSTIAKDVEVVTKLEAQNIETAAEKLKAHPGERLRRHRGEYEVVMIADVAGVRVKARMDKWIESPAAIIDVKKVAAATSPHRSTGTEEGFAGLIASYGYGFRAALYGDIAKALTGREHRWFWIPVEDGPPFCVGVYELSDEDREAGRNEYLGFINQLKTCRESGHWPGFSESVVKIYGPKWWRTMYGGNT